MGNKGYAGTALGGFLMGVGIFTAYIIMKLVLNALGAGELLF